MESKMQNGSPVTQRPSVLFKFMLENWGLGRWGTQIFCIALLLTITTTGCQSTSGKNKHMPNYALSSIEAEWIRNGEPIEFESELWYPVDGVEGFLDSEMRFMGTHQGVEYFIDKVDVRPFSRLYTKFEKNKFRFFEKRINE